MAHPLLIVTRKAGRLASLLARNQMSFKLWAGLAALTLGLWGFNEVTPPKSWDILLNNLFRTMQLVTVQFPKEFDKDIPLQLQIARFLVPGLAALTTFHLIIGALSRPVRMALMPQTADHIIVCGTERLTQAAVDVLAARRRDIVFLTPKIDATRREVLEGQGIIVVEADPADGATFDAVNISRAAALFLTHEDDVRNLDIAMIALGRMKPRPETLSPLTLAVLVDREALARELDLALDHLSRGSKARYVRLSPEREGLKLELAHHAPHRSKRRGDISHTLVFGLSGHWHQILKQLIIAMQDTADVIPHLTLVLDEEEAEAYAEWVETLPDIALVAAITVVNRTPNVLLPINVVDGWERNRTLPQLVVLLRPEAEAFEIMLRLRAQGGDERLARASILVRRVGADLLIGKLAGIGGDWANFGNIAAFGGVVRPESIERILDVADESLAAAMHNHYLDRADKAALGSTEAMAEWRSLPENQRRSNRNAAAHVPVLLASEGLLLVHETAGEAPFIPPPDMLERMARIEHQRWMADRIDHGWRHAAERNDKRREHPAIVPFAALSAKDQQKDRDAVLTVVKLLQATGWRIIPQADAV